MTIVRRKMQNITCRNDVFFAADDKFNVSFNDERHLLVRVSMFRGYQKRHESKAHHHHILSDNHLSLDSFCRMFDWNFAPIRN